MTNTTNFATKPETNTKTKTTQPEQVNESYKKFAEGSRWIPFDVKEVENLTAEKKLVTGIVTDDGEYSKAKNSDTTYIKFKILTYSHETERHKGVRVLIFEKWTKDPLTFNFIKKLIEEGRLKDTCFAIRGKVEQQKYQIQKPDGTYELDDANQRREIALCTTRPQYPGDILPLNAAEWPERDEAIGTKVIDDMGRLTFTKLQKKQSKPSTAKQVRGIIGN